MAPNVFSDAMALHPPFDDNFALGIELDGIHALAVQVAEEGVFLAAEGEGGRWRGHADIDADIAGVHAVFEFARVLAVIGENAGGIAVAALIDDIHRFVEGVGFHQGENGTEDFFVRHGGIGLHIGDQGGADPGALLVTSDAEVAAVDHHFGAFVLRFGRSWIRCVPWPSR